MSKTEFWVLRDARHTAALLLKRLLCVTALLALAAALVLVVVDLGRLRRLWLCGRRDGNGNGVRRGRVLKRPEA